MLLVAPDLDHRNDAQPTVSWMTVHHDGRPTRSTYHQFDNSPSINALDALRGNSSQPRLAANASVKRRDQTGGGYTDPAGLTVLHEPDGVPLADLVFVHGVGGGSLRTWTNEHDQADSFWPMNWLSSETVIASARISTYGFGPPASTSPGDPDRLLDISDLAKDLLAKLRFGQGREGRSLNVGCIPLIFVSHSLGGLIAKKAYLLAISDSNATYGQIAQATSAFVFFSTPHRGLHQSSVLNDVLMACVAEWRLTHGAELLRRHLPKMQNINDKFRDLLAPLHVYSFYERPLGQSPLCSGSFVLPHHVATLDHPNEIQIPLDAEHTSITKYTSRTDPNYSSVRGALRLLVEKFKSRRRSDFPDDTANQTEEVSRLLHGCDAPQDDLSEFSEKRIAGSCEWVLRHPTMDLFLTDDAAQPQVLWCFGGPGSGKSVTATYIIESLIEDSKACAYYYFRSGYQVKNSLSQFLTSTALQLSRCIPEYRRKLSTLAGDSFDINKAGHKLLWKKLYSSTLLQCNTRQPFYIVLDGLDELNQTRELLQRLFVEMENASVPLRLLLVSRPTLEIETSVERLSKRMDVQRLPLDNNAEDLEMYVREEMEFMPGTDSFKEMTVNEILVKADRNFLWAHLVVQEIVECQTEVQVEQALQQVPRDLAPLYRRMDDRLADVFRSRPQDTMMGRTIIMWAACARRPLNLDELENALEHDFPRIMDMRQTIQRLCGEFVTVDKRGYVSIMHSSARDFLMSNTDLNYHVSLRRAHHALFTRCIGVLTSGRRDHHTLKDAARAFLLYAASSWPFHLTQSSDFEDHSSLTSVLALLRSRAVLDWMFMLAYAGQLRAIVQASKALGDLLKILDKADAERSPLMHRLADKEVLLQWVQDLIRVVGKFGPQITRTPKTVYRLLPAFCPRESVLYRQFSPGHHTSMAREESPLEIRGRLNPMWDDCFAKFAVTGDSTPSSILSLDRYFAILTKGNGTVHLHYSNTCEIARRLPHGDHVLTFCADSPVSRIATYGFKKTMVWDIESGRLLYSIENPSHTKALAISFQRSDRGDDLLLTFSDDRIIRACSLEAIRFEWDYFGRSLDNDSTHPHQVNAPHNAQFSPDGLYIAISYRGANPAVWYLGANEPHFVAHFDHRSRSSRRSAAHLQQHTRILYVQSFAWNPLTGHLLGTFYGGMVFKWHPQDDTFATFDSRGEIIKCSADGKLFVTGSNEGILRIWDFEHFTPITQLRYPLRIQDLDIGRNQARLYDLREHYCNIWEPSSLLRALEGDDIASDTHSSRESEQQSLAAESVREQEEFEPVTAFSAMKLDQIYAIGDDAGKITISDFDGHSIVELTDGIMSIEQLAWCDNACLLASVDLGRGITIRTFDNLRDQSCPVKSVSTLKSISEVEEIEQTLIQADGNALMVVTPSAVKLHPLQANVPQVVLPIARPGKWIMHPQDASLALGFSAHQVTVLPWLDPANSTSVEYETFDPTGSHSDRGSLRLPNPRRPSQAHPTSPSEIDETVHDVYISPNSSLVMIEIYGATRQTRRRSACLLAEMKHLSSDGLGQSLVVQSIPSILMDALYVSLGFVDADALSVPGRRGTFAEHRRSVSRRHHDLSTFVFVDRDFWVCSADIGSANIQNSELEIHKHFFLPRDWQNSEWMEMATVTPDGNVLCPRNGAIARLTRGSSGTKAERNSSNQLNSSDQLQSLMLCFHDDASSAHYRARRTWPSACKCSSMKPLRPPIAFPIGIIPLRKAVNDDEHARDCRQTLTSSSILRPIIPTISVTTNDHLQLHRHLIQHRKNSSRPQDPIIPSHLASYVLLLLQTTAATARSSRRNLAKPRPNHLSIMVSLYAQEYFTLYTVGLSPLLLFWPKKRDFYVKVDFCHFDSENPIYARFQGRGSLGIFTRT
ncbi:uncharacterized protein MYCFIDRAFT_170768 [Pseudocercospora fijiensis CIRAD86]|uniref:NACHT domain-containing protein n=1 Tax=Pseudocercospora fijiensis (strain CIRAD86) TaxID=383855 RepID=N1Q8T4_PSEFD|nr:uncharacterized protein MYCFIDRAFT_170768 [Pseudocercospora fijiensis CIRAD86]EME89289.1 hypothetical protein MYCFIDRAFT_170768 [Pseudocercospora fijiensis CIRAD86]